MALPLFSATALSAAEYTFTPTTIMHICLFPGRRILVGKHFCRSRDINYNLGESKAGKCFVKYLTEISSGIYQKLKIISVLFSFLYIFNYS